MSTGVSFVSRPMITAQEAPSALMRIAPLFPAATGLIVGILLDHSFQFSLVAYLLIFVLVCLPAIPLSMRETIGPLLVFVAAACVGGALHLQAGRTIPSSSIEHFVDVNGPIARIRGKIISEPQILDNASNPFSKWTYQVERTAFLLEAESIEGVDGSIPVSGRIRATIQQAVLDLRENEEVELFGRLYALTPPRNPGGFDWAGFLRRQGVVATLACDHRLNIRRLGHDATGRSWITWLRITTRGLLTDDLATGTPEEVSLLEAMVLGHRSRFDRRLNEVFIRAGVIHFIAVSGTNVAVLMSFVWSIGRLFRRTKRRCTWLMVLSILVYALVADPRPPILRATVMGLLFCAALLMLRPTTTLNWTSAAAVILVLIDPLTVFDAGFQLSFAAVLGVGYLAPALRRALVSGGLWIERVVLNRPFAAQDRQLVRAATTLQLGPAQTARHLSRKALKILAVLVAACVGAWLAGLPIVATYFHRVQPWGAISSAIVFPLMSIVMVLGVLKVAITAVSPGLASVVAFLLDVTDGWLVQVVEFFAALPGADLTISTPPWWLVAAFYAFLMIFTFRFPPVGVAPSSPSVVRRFLNGQRPIPATWSLAAFAILVVCVVAWCWPEGRREKLRVTVLAVGRGSATVLELPDGQTVLYDSGTSLPSDVGRNVVGPFLNHRGIRHIDHAYISHANLDHFSGLPTVLDLIDADTVIINPCFEPHSPPKSPSRHLLNLLSMRGRHVQTLDTSKTAWEFGGVAFELLWPHGACDPQLSENDASTVLQLSYAGSSLLLTGDIEDRAQRALLERGDLHADVLLLPHHGSVRGSTADFFRAVSPQIAIQSSNEGMARIADPIRRMVGDVPLYNTADVGAVEVILDRNGVLVATPCLNAK